MVERSNLLNKISIKKIICALVISLMLSSFARATIQDIQVSNNTNAAVAISWITDTVNIGEVHYSEHPDLSNSLTAYDTRGQIFAGCTHYIDISNLKKKTTYYFEVVSGSEVDNNSDSYYTFKTMKEPFAPPGICVFYGYVYQENGATPAEGAITHLWLTHNGVDAYPLSKLISSQGSFLFNIKEARSVETDDIFPSFTVGDPIHLRAVYCGNYSADKNLVFEGCTQDCGSMTLVYSPSTTTSPPPTSSTTTPTTALTTTPTTVPTTVPPTTTTSTSTLPTTTAPVVITTTTLPSPVTTSTSTRLSTSTITTTKPSTTTTTTLLSTTSTIPSPECKVTLNISSANVLPWEKLQFNASTYCDGEVVAGDYVWYVNSTINSSIDKESGLYKAGTGAGTDVVTVIDTANGNCLATAEVVVSFLWPMAYDKMWGDKKGEILSLLRTFRDKVLADSEIGRHYIFMLYNNSLEILILLVQNPSLMEETKVVIDELLPVVQSLLEGKKTRFSEEQVTYIESLFDHFEERAISPRLKIAIKKVRKDLREGILFKQFGITVNKSLIGR